MIHSPIRLNTSFYKLLCEATLTTLKFNAIMALLITTETKKKLSQSPRAPPGGGKWYCLC